MTAVAAAGLDGRVLVVAPHMDDESLGCGLLLATHPDKSQVHVAFVTDGSRSPEPAGGSRAMAATLAAQREGEARAALDALGIPAANAHFLGFEDGSLAQAGERLDAALEGCVRGLQPQRVFVPFRYDRHPDHLAINRALCAARRAGRIEAEVLEYFVYSQWRLLPAGDVRAYLPDAGLRRLGPGPEWAAQLKRQALECHRSQVTRYFEWQRRPVLTPELLDRVCAEPEAYLPYDPALPGSRVFTRARLWIALAHRLEPVLKRWKDRVLVGGPA